MWRGLVGSGKVRYAGPMALGMTGSGRVWSGFVGSARVCYDGFWQGLAGSGRVWWGQVGSVGGCGVL